MTSLGLMGLSQLVTFDDMGVGGVGLRQKVTWCLHGRRWVSQLMTFNDLGRGGVME